MPSLYDKNLNGWDTLPAHNVIGPVDDQDIIDKLLINTNFDAVKVTDHKILADLLGHPTVIDEEQPFAQGKAAPVVLESIAEEIPSLFVRPIRLEDTGQDAPAIGASTAHPISADASPTHECSGNGQNSPPSRPLANSNNEQGQSTFTTDTPKQTDQNAGGVSDGLFKHNTTQSEQIAAVLEDALTSTDTLETLSSLVQNHPKVEKFVITGDFVVNKFIQKESINTQETSAMPVTTKTGDNPVQVVDNPRLVNNPVNSAIVADVSALSYKEWQAYQEGQAKLLSQYQQRLAKVEKKLRRTALLNSITLIFAGLALMAAASCYLKVG